MKLHEVARSPRTRYKYRVLWVNPDTNEWEVYQSGLSRQRANDLADGIQYGHGARWFSGPNPEVRVEIDR